MEEQLSLCILFHVKWKNPAIGRADTSTGMPSLVFCETTKASNLCTMGSSVLAPYFKLQDEQQTVLVKTNFILCFHGLFHWFVGA